MHPSPKWLNCGSSQENCGSSREKLRVEINADPKKNLPLFKSALVHIFSQEAFVLMMLSAVWIACTIFPIASLTDVTCIWFRKDPDYSGKYQPQTIITVVTFCPLSDRYDCWRWKHMSMFCFYSEMFLIFVQTLSYVICICCMVDMLCRVCAHPITLMYDYLNLSQSLNILWVRWNSVWMEVSMSMFEYPHWI